MVRGRRNPLHFGLPTRLRRARQAAELTPKAVVQKLGGDQATVRDIEQGTRIPTVRTIARLALALKVSPAWLAYGIGEPMAETTVGTCETMGVRLQTSREEKGLTKAALARLGEPSAASARGRGTPVDRPQGAQPLPVLLRPEV